MNHFAERAAGFFEDENARAGVFFSGADGGKKPGCAAAEDD
jgi:hypothetical protein